ncbi:winged helix-turn-helix domain-containing protein [Streptomyces acidicola]|uniref:winged helix-turn-helix domain-containing protein n=1 Tax=Streptomyces acidicola TaxID=2596892 RepID=UPI0038264941
MSAERGDGGGAEFERVLENLRGRITDGTYALGALLPPQRELAQEFGVSRDTVQRVLRELKSERLVESRQGSGTRVVKKPIHSLTRPQDDPLIRPTLAPFINRAFAQKVVRLDVFTLTSESLDAHIRMQALRIRAQEIPPPERIEVRLLLPATSTEFPYLRALGVKKSADGLDEAPPLDRLQERVQERFRGISARHTSSLRASLIDLETEGVVPSARVEIRQVPVAPTFKLYLRRNAEALSGPYEVLKRTIRLDDGTEIEALDVLGLGSTLLRYVNDEGDPNSTGSVYMESMQAWFDSCWEHLATPV